MSFGIPYKNTINGERYVYYQRLFTDEFDDPIKTKMMHHLGEKALNSLNYRLTEGSNAEKIAEYFTELRDQEYIKEVKMLEEKFGRKISATYNLNSNDEVGVQLIEAFNRTLSLKKVFERNLALIQETNGQKQLITWFGGYFEKQLHENSSLILDDIRDNYANYELQQAVKIAFDKWIPILVRNALIYMFDSADTETGIKKDRDRLQKAYKELLPYLQDINNSTGNAFIDSFISAYGLDNLADMVTSQFNTLEKLNVNLHSFNYTGKINVHSKGGLASENLLNFIAQAANGDIKNFAANLTGATGQKADAIFTVDVPTDLISNWMENNRFGPRSENVASMQKLKAQLNEFTDGFIVYTNAKNYTLNNDFHGFSSGEAISLETWDDIMHYTHIKGRDFIFSIMQLIPGAVGEGRTEEVSRMFARAIALALFDDFDTVGTVQKQGTNSIHLLYLNGIYFPLSFYFSLLADAFREFSQTAVSSLVRVDFNLPNRIMFPTMEDQQGHPRAWTEQQQEAFNYIKISFHFLQGYKKLMRRLEFR